MIVIDRCPGGKTHREDAGRPARPTEEEPIMKINFKLSVSRISILLFSVIICFGSLEVASRFVWKKRYNQWLEKQLHGYDYLDYKRSLIVPKPNTKVTVGYLRKSLEELEKTIGLEHLQRTVQRDNLPESAVLFSINKHGFKGPEFSMHKSDSIFRILAIGDSCTWGVTKDYYTYPRTMERTLNRLTDKNFDFEVINAGVQGYNFERVLKRIDEFLEVDPDLVTIYLGWNRTIGRVDPSKSQFLYRNLVLYKVYYHSIVNKKDTGLQYDYNTKTFYKEDTDFIKEIENYNFSYDIKSLDRLIKKIRNKNKKIEIILITLPGLFDYRVEPDKRALEIGNPIAATNNLYARAILTKKYNEELRNYAREHKLDIFDLETYALSKFVPRSAYFGDAVHPNVAGYLEIGEYFAKELIRIKNFKRKSI